LGIKLFDIKSVFLISSKTFIRKVSHCEKNSARCCHKCENVFMQSTRYFCRILMKLEFSQRLLEKSSNIKFYQSPSSGSRLIAFGRTNRQTEGLTDMTKIIVAFRNFVNTSKTVIDIYYHRLCTQVKNDISIITACFGLQNLKIRCHLHAI
jgi:hypothetical protein